ncbi:hypothetical protein [Microbacterium sp. 22296]|uniref:hypothetical protein n=1 Tax=Microbacterium sp. 22296 TaxID=3453903 RepID=UPI003F8460E8
MSSPFFLGSASHTVTASCVVVRLNSGSQVNLYKGQDVPTDIVHHQLRELIAGGLVAEKEVAS